MVRGGRLLGLPLPRAWFGRGVHAQRRAPARYVFRTDTRLPLLGQLVAYCGWLEATDD